MSEMTCTPLIYANKAVLTAYVISTVVFPYSFACCASCIWPLTGAHMPVNKARQRAEVTSSFLEKGQFRGSRGSSDGLGTNRTWLSRSVASTVIVTFSSVSDVTGGPGIVGNSDFV